jgi:hypothetical protein
MYLRAREAATMKAYEMQYNGYYKCTLLRVDAITSARYYECTL